MFLGDRLGFTLLEVMVALMIFAIASSVLMVTSGNAVSFTRKVYERQLALLLADVYMNRMIVEDYWSDLGVKEKKISYAGKDWFVREKVGVMPKDTKHRRVQLVVFTVNEDKKGTPRCVLTSSVKKITDAS